MLLDHRPEGLLRELLQRLPLPAAVVTLDQPVLDHRRGLRQRQLQGLPAADQRTGDDGGQRHRPQPFAHRRGLGAPGVVQLDRLPTGQATVGVRRRTAVSQKQKGRHTDHPRAYAAPSTAVGSAPPSRPPPGSFPDLCPGWLLSRPARPLSCADP
ncbi:Conserved exported hypothetical protein [Micromonospora lupini str. Lupac 08]|uniref:Uncharacterized protein n=1 Tax=Micromonospora lupini str. Lupac 08 TaxID=1150864 RepID=I0L3M6_9ACTN|nr:Conserved exported hypothetical protein [Micromonospora lupini str. Lupac 08]